MRYYGEFVTVGGKVCSVEIVTNGDKGETKEIGADGLYFCAEDPVRIDSGVNNTFDVLLPHSATVRLLSESYIADLFCTSALYAKVNVRVDDECVFAGYVEPMTYSQPYNEVLDELELNCVDALSALQYCNYKEIAQGASYREAKRDAKQRTFIEYLWEGMQMTAAGLDLSGAASNPQIYYDCSKAVSADDEAYNVLAHLSVSDLLFLGDEMDDTWTYKEIIEEVLRYLNLHIVQVGLRFYIFDWATIRSTAGVKWLRLMAIVASGEDVPGETIAPAEVTLRNEVAGGTDAQLTVGEVFNRLELTANVTSVESLVVSPLDDEYLSNAFNGKQKYLTEYSSDGEGESAYKAFRAMVQGTETSYDAAVQTDWYVQVKDNSAWQFAGGGVKDFYGKYASGNKNQHAMLNAMVDDMSAAIVAVGSVENKKSEDDNSLVSSIEMTNCLFITTNGNAIGTSEKSGDGVTGGDGDLYGDSEDTYYPNDEDILDAIPMATYTGGTTGGVLSPTDSDTKNYIVISGKLILNPVMWRTDNMACLVKRFGGESITQEESDSSLSYERSRNYTPYWHYTMPSRNNGDGRYYAQEFWQAATPRTKATIDRTHKFGLTPFTGAGPEWYKYDYAQVGDTGDTISKVPVLCCMLIVGSKCVVEEYVDDAEYITAGTGKKSKFVWKDYKERSACADDAEYYAQSFTVGFDPRKQQKLVGTEFSIQNTIDYTMGVEATGTAIPIEKSDHISGKVQFMILGPVNLIWNKVVRRHPSFWRHTSWSESSVPLMAHCSSIIIKEFEIKVYSDNGLETSGEDNDYVYYSDTDETYYNKKDDLEFKITSGLTSAEAVEMGVENKVALSTPSDTRSGDAVVAVYDARQDVTAKAEQLYVDAYYSEYHQPKVELTQKVELGDALGVDAADLWHTLFTHPAISKTFYVEGVSLYVKDDCAELKLKEL